MKWSLHCYPKYFFKMLRTVIISSFVFEGDKERRIAFFATSFPFPKASKTWEGKLAPLLHADPELAQMPCMSNSTSRSSPLYLLPTTEKFIVFGITFSNCEFREI